MEVLLSNALSCFSQVPVIRSSSRTHQTTGFLLQIEKQRVVPRLHVGTQTRLRAQPMDMALSLASEPDRDPVVLLQVSALLLFVYWIANFVVPGFIMKGLQQDETPEDKGSS